MAELIARKIDLAPDCLTDPTRLDIARIGLHMLFPAHGAAEANSVAPMRLSFTTGALCLPTSFSPDFIGEAFDQTRFLEPVWNVRSPALWRESTHGGIAGLILLRAAGRSPSAPNVSMGKIFEETSRHFYSTFLKHREATHFRIGHKSIHSRIWPQYRCVSPYWAAFIFITMKSLDKDKFVEFPCSLELMWQFLVMAEFFRNAGESINTRHSPSAVLRIGETVLIPDEIRLHVNDELCRISSS